MLLEGHNERDRERMEVARWICFHIYSQNPYIKQPKARTLQAYIRFPWEGPAAEDAEAMKERCHITPEEQAELDRIFKEVFGEL